MRPRFLNLYRYYLEFLMSDSLTGVKSADKIRIIGSFIQFAMNKERKANHKRVEDWLGRDGDELRD